MGNTSISVSKETLEKANKVKGYLGHLAGRFLTHDEALNMVLTDRLKQIEVKDR